MRVPVPRSREKNVFVFPAQNILQHRASAWVVGLRFLPTIDVAEKTTQRFQVQSCRENSMECISEAKLVNYVGDRLPAGCNLYKPENSWNKEDYS